MVKRWVLSDPYPIPDPFPDQVEVVLSCDYDKLAIALRDMHRMVHDHVFRSGTPRGFPEGSRTIGPEVLIGINRIIRNALGRNDESLKYYTFPDDASLKT